MLKPLAAVLPLALTLLAASPTPSPWTGTWRLNLKRSSAVAASGAADAYRFNVGSDATLRWEIPSLGEVVKGRLDGQPMPIVRKEKDTGLTLAVRAAGPAEWTYDVAHDRKHVGGGRMILIDDGKSWVDLSWGPDGPGHGVELVYTRTRK